MIFEEIRSRRKDVFKEFLSLDEAICKMEFFEHFQDKYHNAPEVEMGLWISGFLTTREWCNRERIIRNCPSFYLPGCLLKSSEFISNVKDWSKFYLESKRISEDFSDSSRNIMMAVAWEGWREATLAVLRRGCFDPELEGYFCPNVDIKIPLD